MSDTSHIERHLDRMTSPEVAAAAASPNAVVVQPIGAVEQHGRHLPCGVDAIIAGALVEAALDRTPDHIGVWTLPTMPYGKSNEHVGFPGTISLSADTLYALCRDIGRSVAASGFRKLAFVNGHGGQPQLLETVARDIRIETGLQVFPIHAYRLPAMHGVDAADGDWGIHGGEVETSLMLAIEPGAVRFDRAAAWIPPVSERFRRYRILSLEGGVPTAWVTSDLSASGVIGDPTGSTAASGRSILDLLASDLATAFEEIADFEFDQTTTPKGTI